MAQFIAVWKRDAHAKVAEQLFKACILRANG